VSALAARRIAGVDEAGRGPLAGPVVAAAVIFHPRRIVRGLDDSKQLSPDERARLAPLIRERAVAWAVGWADREEIDCLNILEATFLAMHVEVDGNRLPRIDDLKLGCTVEAIIGGDASRPAISAASILAKTFRDDLMERLDARYPGFDLAVHKGYSTPAHLAALGSRPPTPLHRRSFSPVRLALQG
jgi:ribonuclease HII